MAVTWSRTIKQTQELPHYSQRVGYGVPLRSKYPDSEMLFQKQNISRDLQNMMRKLYFIDPDQKKFEFHFSIIRLPMEKKNSRSKIR